VRIGARVDRPTQKTAPERLIVRKANVVLPAIGMQPVPATDISGPSPSL